MAVDPPGQTSKMAYLHQKRLNFIQEGQNERRYSLAGIKKAHLQWKIPKQAGAELCQAQHSLSWLQISLDFATP